MSLDADMVIERRRLKRHLTFWRVVGILAIVLAILSGFGRFNVSGEEYLARIVIQGIIVDNQARDEALRKVAKNNKSKALIVKINSPGGTYVGGEALYEAIRQVSKEKPVVALMGTTATSAGYMTALATDQIFARSSSLTGSIGVILQSVDITSMLEKIGVKPIVIKSAPLKAQPNPFENFSKTARKATESVVEDFYNMFIDIVSERRNLPRNKVKELADGRVFSGRQAQSLGLVDAIGAEAEARKWLFDVHKIANSLPIKDVEIDSNGMSWLDLLNSKIEKVIFSERLSLDGLISLWQPNIQ
ncbi:MAG: signal peptide peptidase SppA [Pseudomonadota bacterium]|nr:signal peptide peptidase SppA [Pseudomonadota bacterium]